MNDTILVVGAGPTGLSAAHGIASIGRKVVLVDKADRLGGAPILSGYAKLVPSGEWAKDAIGRMIERVEKNNLIKVHKHTTKVTKSRWRARQFHGDALERRDGAGQRGGARHRLHPLRLDQQARVGLRHLRGRGHHDPGRADGGRGARSPVPPTGARPERVAILLCVGSRDRQIGREWCSKICCTVSTNLAMEIKELSPKTDVYIYYMDIRTFGLYEDKFYWKSQEEFGTKFVKARIAEVTIAPDGKRLLVKGEDTLVKRPIVIPFDLVVHAIGMDPNEDNPEIAKVFGVGLEHHGFVDRGEHYTSSFASTRPGIYVGGSALGPEDIDTCVSHGLAMAMRAVGDLEARARKAA